MLHVKPYVTPDNMKSTFTYPPTSPPTHHITYTTTQTILPSAKIGDEKIFGLVVGVSLRSGCHRSDALELFMLHLRTNYTINFLGSYKYKSTICYVTLKNNHATQEHKESENNKMKLLALHFIFVLALMQSDGKLKLTRFLNVGLRFQNKRWEPFTNLKGSLKNSLHIKSAKSFVINLKDQL